MDRNLLEPGALFKNREPDMQPTEHEIEMSKAVSLKRIADALAKNAGVQVRDLTK